MLTAQPAIKCRVVAAYIFSEMVFILIVMAEKLWIYVLRLRGNRYYVGKTTNPKFSLEGHVNDSGCTWFKKHPPVQFQELIPNCDSLTKQSLL